MWGSDVSALHSEDTGDLKMGGIHSILWPADSNDRSCCFGRAGLWLARHQGSGVFAYDFFMAGSELERFEKVKILTLGSLCHLDFSFYPRCVLGCRCIWAQPVAWPSFADGPWKRNVHDSVSVWENESWSDSFSWKLCFKKPDGP